MRMNKLYRVLPLVIVFCLTGCGEASISSVSSSRKNGRLADIHVTYLTNNNPAETSPYNGNMSVSAPNPVRLSWNGENISSYKVSLYNDENKEELNVSYTTSKNYFDFYNDEFDRTYYWTVSGGGVTSKVNSFTYHPTLSQPRNMFVDGVENFRDLGGWGKYDSVTDTYTRYMKQGMIYRSGRFNEYDDDLEQSINTISKFGIYEMNNHLKIKTEIDLRRSSTNETGGITSSVLGEQVKYVNLPMYYGGLNILTFVGKASKDDYQYDNPAAIKQFFDLLADENNYPINFHCSIGKDRTGCLAYLIEGLLGFEQEIMYRDYMFTNFSNAGMCKLNDDIINRYGATLEAYEGANLQEKVFNYLKDVIGVSESNLNTIINLLKESN